jgi:lipid-A-disaccharide synthase
MKYFIIAGEASGDLHASGLMAALKKKDPEAEFCFLGGNLMQAQGGRMVKHYKEMAFMGIIPVLLHLRTVLNNIKIARKEILSFRPDAVILVDYPGFNLKIAKFVKKNMLEVPVYYYISPKLWAWKEYRIKSIKKYVDKVYSILPFEIDFYKKYNYTVDYVGNPCVDAIENRSKKNETFPLFVKRHQLPEKPIIALLAGSRIQEIKSSLPIMLAAASQFKDYQLIIAGAPAIDKTLYESLTERYQVTVIYGETYEILQQATLAVVTSGTATLETALLSVPQVVVYKMSGGKLFHRFLKLFIKVPYISLVNLIAGKELVKELVIEEFNAENVQKEIENLLNHEQRKKMLAGYRQLIDELGNTPVAEKTADFLYQDLRLKQV